MILMIAGQRSTSKTCADLKATLYFDKVQFAESNIPFSFSDIVIVIVIVTEFPQIWMGLRDRFCLNFDYHKATIYVENMLVFESFRATLYFDNVQSEYDMPV